MRQTLASTLRLLPLFIQGFFLFIPESQALSITCSKGYCFVRTTCGDLGRTSDSQLNEIFLTASKKVMTSEIGGNITRNNCLDGITMTVDWADYRSACKGRGTSYSPTGKSGGAIRYLRTSSVYKNVLACAYRKVQATEEKVETAEQTKTELPTPATPADEVTVGSCPRTADDICVETSLTADSSDVVRLKVSKAVTEFLKPKDLYGEDCETAIRKMKEVLTATTVNERSLLTNRLPSELGDGDTVTIALSRSLIMKSISNSCYNRCAEAIEQLNKSQIHSDARREELVRGLNCTEEAKLRLFSPCEAFIKSRGKFEARQFQTTAQQMDIESDPIDVYRAALLAEVEKYFDPA